MEPRCVLFRCALRAGGDLEKIRILYMYIPDFYLIVFPKILSWFPILFVSVFPQAAQKQHQSSVLNTVKYDRTCILTVVT